MVDLNENTIPNLILSKHIEKTKFNVKIINELNLWGKKINKMLASLIKLKQAFQIYKIRKEEKIATNTKEIKRIY